MKGGGRLRWFAVDNTPPQPQEHHHRHGAAYRSFSLLESNGLGSKTLATTDC